MLQIFALLYIYSAEFYFSCWGILQSWRVISFLNQSVIYTKVHVDALVTVSK